MWRGLAVRRDHPGLFAEGQYVPLTCGGARAEYLFAFARRFNEMTAVTVVPRLLVGLESEPYPIPTLKRAKASGWGSFLFLVG